jgi:hypothetical protein
VVHVDASVYLHVQQLEVPARAGRLDEARFPQAFTHLALISAAWDLDRRLG